MHHRGAVSCDSSASFAVLINIVNRGTYIVIVVDVVAQRRLRSVDRTAATATAPHSLSDLSYRHSLYIASMRVCMAINSQCVAARTRVRIDDYNSQLSRYVDTIYVILLNITYRTSINQTITHLSR